MFSLVPPDQDNDGIMATLLKRFIKKNKAIDIECLKIKSAQNKYKKVFGSPTIEPITLDKWLSKFLLARYNNAAKRRDLHWIGKLRDGIDLQFCPMCGHSGLGTIDHLLPKARYPEFAIFTHNLVPSCACNSRRSMGGADSTLPAYIHPYFDSGLLDKLELVVRFDTNINGGVAFNLIAQGVSGFDLKRVDRHLKDSLSDPVLYRDLWPRFNTYWRIAHRTGTIKAAAERLIEELENVSHLPHNAWPHVLIRSITQDVQIVKWMIANSPCKSEASEVRANP